MRYRVFIQPNAKNEIEEAYLWLAERSPGAAATWYNGLADVLLSLETLARRCPVAPEDSVFSRKIRQLLYGSYRVLFTITGHDVQILHVRHHARDCLK
jgi:plasmid stabilization system protein ParE